MVPYMSWRSTQCEEARQRTECLLWWDVCVQVRGRVVFCHESVSRSRQSLDNNFWVAATTAGLRKKAVQIGARRQMIIW